MTSCTNYGSSFKSNCQSQMMPSVISSLPVPFSSTPNPTQHQSFPAVSSWHGWPKCWVSALLIIPSGNTQDWSSRMDCISWTGLHQESSVPQFQRALSGFQALFYWVTLIHLTQLLEKPKPWLRWTLFNKCDGCLSFEPTHIRLISTFLQG